MYQDDINMYFKVKFYHKNTCKTKGENNLTGH